MTVYYKINGKDLSETRVFDKSDRVAQIDVLVRKIVSYISTFDK